MYAIRPNSVFAKIGMQNGDTISSINGFDMTSPDKALEVYTKVRSASNLSVSLVRRGQPVSMEYAIK
jgi:general secretion pathway protein C